MSIQMISNPPLDFLPQHSRSNSVSSNHSAHSSAFNRLPPGAIPEDLYRPPYHHSSPHTIMHPDSVCFYSPPLFHPQSLIHHQIQNHPSALKPPLRPSHIRARVAASPYPRDTDSLSSSSETEDMSLYLSAQSANNYPAQLYGPGPSLGPPSREAIHAAGALGRMSLSQDQGLEKLAANVRAATTTSASDRAKQIFVQAWSVLLLFVHRSYLNFFFFFFFLSFTLHQAWCQLCSLPRWQCSASGSLFFLSPCVRPVWHPPY